jgi:hypothetical protein
METATKGGETTMAKTVQKSATVKTAYGQELDTPIDFTYDYVELAESDAIPSDEVPTETEILSYVNMKRNASARSTAQAKALSAAGIQKPTNEDPKTALFNMVKLLMTAQKLNQETAEQIARGVLNTPADVVIGVVRV